MEFFIKSWLSIPDNLRNQIIWIVSFTLPAFCVIYIKNKWIKYPLAILAFIGFIYLDIYISCYGDLVDYCPPENYEIGTLIMTGLFGLLYCLLIELIVWMIKTLRNYLSKKFLKTEIFYYSQGRQNTEN